MFIQTVSTLVLYCPCCGKTPTYELSPFHFKGTQSRKLICSCGQVQAEVKSVTHGQFLLDIPCSLCQTRNMICIGKQYRTVEKIYCREEQLELGFVGNARDVEDTIAQYKHGLETIFASDAEIKNPQVLIGILNRLHDIAENGKLRCECGSMNIEGQLVDDGIELYCINCGTNIKFTSQVDELRYLKSVNCLELISKQYFHRKQ